MDVTIQLLTSTNQTHDYSRTLNLYDARWNTDNASPDEPKAEFHFIAALAAFMMSHPRMGIIVNRMRSCEDYSDHLLGDFYREQAVFKILNRDLDTAESLLIYAYECRVEHAPETGDFPDNLGLYEQVKYWQDIVVLGRLREAYGQLKEAHELLSLAVTKLQKLHRESAEQTDSSLVADAREHLDRVATEYHRSL